MGLKRSTRRDCGFSIFAKIVPTILWTSKTLCCSNVCSCPRSLQMSLFYAFKLPKTPLRIWTVSRWTSASLRAEFQSKCSWNFYTNSGISQNYISASASVAVCVHCSRSFSPRNLQSIAQLFLEVVSPSSCTAACSFMFSKWQYVWINDSWPASCELAFSATSTRINICQVLLRGP